MHGDLGDAVHIDQTGLSGGVTGDPRGKCMQLQRFPPKDDAAQGMRRGILSRNQLTKSTGRLIQYGDLLTAQQRIERLR